MASEEKPKKERGKHDILEFLPQLGDLRPVEEMRGPKTPSRRMVLQNFLYFVAMGSSLLAAAEIVVPSLMKKHPMEVMKTPKKLRDDIIDLYQALR